MSDPPRVLRDSINFVNPLDADIVVENPQPEFMIFGLGVVGKKQGGLSGNVHPACEVNEPHVGPLCISQGGSFGPKDS